MSLAITLLLVVVLAVSMSTLPELLVPMVQTSPLYRITTLVKMPPLHWLLIPAALLLMLFLILHQAPKLQLSQRVTWRLLLVAILQQSISRLRLQGVTLILAPLVLQWRMRCQALSCLITPTVAAQQGALRSLVLLIQQRQTSIRYQLLQRVSPSIALFLLLVQLRWRVWCRALLVAHCMVLPQHQTLLQPMVTST